MTKSRGRGRSSGTPHFIQSKKRTLCSFCSFQAQDNTELAQHEESLHFACKICGRFFGGINNLREVSTITTSLDIFSHHNSSRRLCLYFTHLVHYSYVYAIATCRKVMEPITISKFYPYVIDVGSVSSYLSDLSYILNSNSITPLPSESSC